MVHGDLKGVYCSLLGFAVLISLFVQANILIDETVNARLADFGLLTIISDPANLLSSSSYTPGGTVQWMSPELIYPQRFGLEKTRPTESSDCYAPGMVVYEIISGRLPFHEHPDVTVFMKVLEGEHPPHEVNFPEHHGSCWNSVGHPNRTTAPESEMFWKHYKWRQMRQIHLHLTSADRGKLDIALRRWWPDRSYDRDLWHIITRYPPRQ